MNKLSIERRMQIVSCLVEGASVRSTCRMTGVSLHTALNLLVDIGTVCREYQDTHLRNLPCRRIQCDETWSFCYAKDRNLPAGMRGKPGVGSIWTWVALDAETKLVPCWLVSNGRDAGIAYEFISDLESRLANRVQLTTDGHRAYLSAVSDTFGSTGIDYAQLVKLYGPDPNEGAAHRYSPPICIGAEPTVVCGDPDPEHISTSYIERQNLTMRMNMRRFTRLTNGFSKKFENLQHAVALFYMHYNFVRIHQTLRCTPAMEIGVANRLWSITDIVELLEKKEATTTTTAVAI